MEEKFSKEVEIMKNNQVEILEIKTSINPIQTTRYLPLSVDRSNRRKNIEMGDKIEELLHMNNHN
jgi:hypothetical protein